MRRSKLRFLLFPVLLVVASSWAAPSAWATPVTDPYGTQYDWSEIDTSTTSVINNHGGANANFTRYTGWKGVNGAIQVLGSPPSMQANDHTLVAVSAALTAGGDDFIQVGAYVGRIFESPTAPASCTLANLCIGSSQYDVYVESQSPVAGDYIKDWGGAGTSANIFRIQWDSVAAAWKVYDLYNNELRSFARLNTVMGANAQDEVMAYRRNLNFAMTNATFGNATANSNNALRLLGAAGYVPWNTTLTAGYTYRGNDVDTNPVYHQTFYNSFYYWTGY